MYNIDISIVMNSYTCKNLNVLVSEQMDFGVLLMVLVCVGKHVICRWAKLSVWVQKTPGQICTSEVLMGHNVFNLTNVLNWSFCIRQEFIAHTATHQYNQNTADHREGWAWVSSLITSDLLSQLYNRL